MGVREVFGADGVRVGRRVVSALRDRLVRDVIRDLVKDETLTAYLVAALRINPLAETMGDLEAGRALLNWMREGHDVDALAVGVRDGDEDTHDVRLTVHLSSGRSLNVVSASATRAVLTAVDQIEAQR